MAAPPVRGCYRGCSFLRAQDTPCAQEAHRFHTTPSKLCPTSLATIRALGRGPTRRRLIGGWSEGGRPHLQAISPRHQAVNLSGGQVSAEWKDQAGSGCYAWTSRRRSWRRTTKANSRRKVRVGTTKKSIATSSRACAVRKVHHVGDGRGDVRRM